MVTDAMIVAGGQGTRLRPLTLETPKPLLEFCGEPFLAGVMQTVAAAGVERVWLVVGAQTQPFQDALGATATDLGVELICVPEPEPLDTAGGVQTIVDRLDGPFLVLNGDVLSDVPLAAVIAAHGAAGAEATIVLTEVEETSSFGVCVLEGTDITSFVEKPAPGTLPGQHHINAGTYVLDPSVFAGHRPGRLSFERDVFPTVLARGGRINGFAWSGVWADLGTPDRYRWGTAAALAGELTWPSLARRHDAGGGVRMDPTASVAKDAVLVGPVLIERGARVGPAAIVGPNTVVGVDAHVGEQAVVRDSVLFSGVEVGADVAVSGLLAGRGATVESGARIGDDVVLGDGVRVASGTSVPAGARVPEPSS